MADQANIRVSNKWYDLLDKYTKAEVDDLINKSAVVNIAGGAAISVDMATGGIFVITLDQIATVTILNADAGREAKIELNGGNLYAVTWDANIRWPSGTAPVTTTRDFLGISCVANNVINGVIYGGGYA